jgi:RNA polymerase sigma factor (sigma-70 family)
MAASDEQLMLAYAGGDAGAFEALYARHKGALYRFVLRSVKARGEAEELFQEIWMRAIEARSRYAPQAKFSTWLYTIAHNRLVDHWRAKGLALVSLDDEANPVPEVAADPGSEPHRQVEARQTLERLGAALAALPLAQREAFLLHHEGELTVAEIAAATGSGEEAAKSRLRYAMNKLREAIGDD